MEQASQASLPVIFIGTIFIPEGGCSGGDGNGFIFRYNEGQEPADVSDWAIINPGERLQVINIWNNGWSCCSGFNYYKLHSLEADEEPQEYRVTIIEDFSSEIYTYEELADIPMYSEELLAKYA